MSSHHIVRDLQEPALILANGAPCKDELLGQLLEWSPFTLVLDGAIERACQLGIRVDAWLGDFDSGSEQIYAELSALQPVVKIEAPDADKTDLEKGVEWLIAQGHKAVNIVWATGKRADHCGDGDPGQEETDEGGFRGSGNRHHFVVIGEPWHG